jgi:hypothetical protein
MVGPEVGQRVELGRYTVPAGERVLYGQRVDGKVRVTDRPSGQVTAENRAHLIDNDLGSKAELERDGIPAGRRAVPEHARAALA